MKYQTKNSVWKYVALLSILVAVGFALLWRLDPTTNSELISENPYPLVDPARSVIAQENYIINLTPLREELRTMIAEGGASSTTLYFEFLNTGSNISINPGLKVWPASLAKLPLALSVVKKIERGTWSYDMKLVLEEDDRDTRSGTLGSHAMGTAFTVERLLEEMLVHSDNTAYQTLLGNMVSTDHDPLIYETGLEELADSTGKTDAKEYSRLYRVLYTSSFLKRENSSKILTWLVYTDFDRFLASGLESNVKFANKWGINTGDHVYHDSGIVYIPGRPYILTVMVQGDGSFGEEALVQDLMHDISERVYSYISSYEK
ncbi:MAG TPA: serine hydrolase [Candidatus Paceibacterota bacterium]